MIAGATNAGKTTLLRALANQIPPEERLITVERALELGLDQFPELHPNVVALEERLPNSEGQGAIPMAELVRRSLRMNPSRVIVGEVLGDEIVTMLNAMTQGNDGSLSTIHANSWLEVFNRISTYAIQSAERLPVEATHMLIAGAIDFVVFRRAQRLHPRRPLRRFVNSIREVTGVDGRVLSSEVSRRAGRPRGPARPAGLPGRPGRRTAMTRPGVAGEQPVRGGAAAGRNARRGGRWWLVPAAGRTARRAAAPGQGLAGCAASSAGLGRSAGRARPAGRLLVLLVTRWVVGGRGGAARGGLADARRGGVRAASDGPAGGAGYLDRVAAGHDRRGGRAGAGHPGLAPGGGASLRDRWPGW